jgi:hypothetical protein
MPLSFNEIVDETRQWPEDAVAELVDRIMLARHGHLDPVIEESWRAVLMQRSAAIRNGTVEGVPGDEVSQRLRGMVGL